MDTMFEFVEKGASVADNVIIGPYSVVKAGAKIGKGSVIGAFCFIDSNVCIGEDNYIGHSVHLLGRVQLGRHNHIQDNTVIGLPSEHIGYHFYQGRVIVGDDNFIGNGCAIDCGNNHLSDKYPELLSYLSGDLISDENLEDATIIGNRCYILNNVTIHHNCRVGLGNLKDCAGDYDTVICTGCCLNGFVQVRKGAELSSGTYIREFASLGEGCFTAMSSHIVKDILPFSAILKNKNIGLADKLIQKFHCSEIEVRNLRDNFAARRSGRLMIY